MKRRFRLTGTTDFKRVRNAGKSFAHPLVVLVAAPGNAETIKIGVTTARAIGCAVERNRAKRILRETMRPLLNKLPPGWELILIARQPLIQATFQDVRSAVFGLLKRAHLLQASDDTALPAA